MSSSTRSIVFFLGKMVVAYAMWYVIYDLWLLPDGRLDAWVSRSAAGMSGDLLRGFGVATTVEGRIVSASGMPGVRVVNGCNGLSTIGLFVGFVLAFPGRWDRRALFLPLGAVTIYGANVARIALLAGAQPHWPAVFDGVHELGTTSFYLVVFGLWAVWAHYGGAAADASLNAESGTPPDAPSPALPG